MRRFSGLGLRTRLMMFALMAVLPALGLVVYGQSRTRQAKRESALLESMRLTRSAAHQQSEVLLDIQRFLRTLAELPDVRSGDPVRCNGVLSSVHRLQPKYAGLVVVDADGALVCASAADAVRSLSPDEVRGSSWFQAVVRSAQPAVDAGSTGIVVAYPVADAAGSVELVVAGRVPLAHFSWTEPQSRPSGSTLTLFDRDGTILAMHPHVQRWIGAKVPRSVIEHEDSPIETAAPIKATAQDGQMRLYMTAPVPPSLDAGLRVALGIEPNVATGQADGMVVGQLAWLALVSIATVGLVLVGGEVFVLRPVRRLKEATSRIAAGDLSARAQLATGAPGLSDITDAINAMATALDARERDRDLAESRLRASEDQYRLFFDENPHAMWVFEGETLRFLAVNQAATERYGYSREEFLQLTVKDLHPDGDWPGSDAIEGTETDRPVGTCHHRTKSGAILDVDVRVNSVRWSGARAHLALLDDVTRRRQLEEQLRQSQKMDAIGQLAGGVAHDFNNLLTAIQGYAELLVESLPEHDDRRESADQIAQAALRAGALTRQLLTFGRKQQMLTPRVLRLGDVVAKIMPMIKRLIHESIDLQIVESNDVHVYADAGQLEQVLINLVVNARDAMPAGGRLVVETTEAVLNEEDVRQHPDAQPGCYAVLTVTDAGCGMDPVTCARVFEPFFTTKAPGHGTGLGLATVYGIVRQNAGHITVRSDLGHGTTFRVYLPVATQPPQPEAPVTLPSDERRRGHEAILLVEDEDSVRQFLERMLRQHGYRVHAMTGPAEALAFLQSDDAPLDLLLTDIVMPHMNGRALAARALSIQPLCSVLYISGYTGDVITQHGILEPGMFLLEKPFSGHALIAKVREVLDRRATALVC